jgi:hypothetical protein
MAQCQYCGINNSRAVLVVWCNQIWCLPCLREREPGFYSQLSQWCRTYPAVALGDDRTPRRKEVLRSDEP